MKRIGHAAAPLALAVTAAALAACKAPLADGSRAPSIDSIEGAEEALADNAQRLSDAGVLLPGGAGAAPALGAEQAGEDAEAVAEEEVGESADEDAGVAAEPEPTPTTSPVTPTPAHDYSFEADDAPASKGERQSRRCTRVCDLAEATCDLAQQICDLAQRHEDEPRYQSACSRGQAQCEAASAACDSCED